MKRVKGVFCILLAMIMLLAGCSETENFDDSILNDAAEITSALGYDNERENPFINSSRSFQVDKVSENEFHIDVNGTSMTVKLVDEENSSFDLTDIKDIESKYDTMYSASKELVYKYIEESSILLNKEEIKEYLAGLQLKEAVFTDNNDAAAYFSYEDSTVYINTDNSAYVCEWLLVHELIHAIAFCTHEKDIANEEYPYGVFNEVLTDIITASLTPEIDSSIQSGYSAYYFLIYPYINLVGEEAINAYFYGYEHIYEKINQDEFDFWVTTVLENYGAENSEAYYNNLILKWYATY